MGQWRKLQEVRKWTSQASPCPRLATMRSLSRGTLFLPVFFAIRDCSSLILRFLKRKQPTTAEFGCPWNECMGFFSNTELFCFSWPGEKKLHEERMVRSISLIPYCLPSGRWDSHWRSKFIEQTEFRHVQLLLGFLSISEVHWGRNLV